MKKVLYEFGKERSFFDTEEEAWNAAFEHLAQRSGWPVRISVFTGPRYEMPQILERWWNRSSAPASIGILSPPAKDIPPGQSPAAANILAENPHPAESYLSEKQFARLPEFWKTYYRKKISEGKTLQDLPAIRALLEMEE